MIEPERLIGRLFLVKGDLFDDFHQGGRPLVLLPGYANRVIHPLTEKFAAAYPVLQSTVNAIVNPVRDSPLEHHRVINNDSVTFVIPPSEFMTTHSGAVRLPDYPPERTWHAILVKFVHKHKADSIHWAETGNPDLMDMPANLFRMFVGMINHKPKLNFYYYNPAWPLPPTRFLQ